MQRLWQLQLDWDDPLPAPEQAEWNRFLESLKSINNVAIPRCILMPQATAIEIHGFCDASANCYGAVVYCKSISDCGTKVALVASKSRVAPLKVLTIPRLELCGALILSRLVKKVLTALKLTTTRVFLWCDSMIVLCWLQKQPAELKTFVAHRVRDIQELTAPDQWRHVASEDNPADLISRGQDPDKLISNAMWFNGPEFLNSNVYPSRSVYAPISTSTVPDLKKPKVSDKNLNVSDSKKQHIVQSLGTVCQVTDVDELLNRFSSLSKLKRVTALCLRFVHNCKNPKNRLIGFLTSVELNSALMVLIKGVQEGQFGNEISYLKNNKVLNRESKILNLNPFLDDVGLLRVGGRLRHAEIAYAQKHPLLLPKRHILTDLVVRHHHEEILHAGPQLVQSSIQEKFWIIGARDVIRNVIRKCVKCSKFKLSVNNQLMSDLPSSRISPAPTFSRCGVDYAGPFQLKVSRGRGSRTFKAYIALFVCFTTRAIHLEVVSDLSSDAFIASLKRFVSRRGKCTDIYSDCGTNFVGARRKLLEFEKLSKSKSYNESVNGFLAELGINWHFNVPGAPHMGGLWEAGVKSTKFHLKRVMGDAKLTFEEFQTLLVQIEACLNSRPLTALSSDPGDLSALTPGHFLIGRALTSVPEPNYLNCNVSYLARWQLVQRLVQQFWKRWKNEYLSRLQQRPKWLLPTKNFEVDNLCLLKEDNLPPTKWRLCRVTKLHPGTDGNVRVVTVKTADGVFKRNITKLCLLPI